MKAKTIIVLILVVVAINLLDASPARAQIAGSLSGTVYDSRGGCTCLEPKIAITHQETGQVRRNSQMTRGDIERLICLWEAYEVKALRKEFQPLRGAASNLDGAHGPPGSAVAGRGYTGNCAGLSRAPDVDSMTSQVGGLVHRQQIEDPL